jgi:hypothetical protein
MNRMFGFVLATLFSSCLGCGGGSSTPTPPPPSNPVPAIASLSPSTGAQDGPAFPLVVNGSNFISGSAVEWNGTTRPTTFISSTQLTAQIPPSDIITSGVATITVFNPTPGGGMSNSLSFNVPCAIPNLAAPAGQTLARVGSYYFDGWAGPLTEFHFNGLVNGTYQDRQPLSGWRDDNTCAVEQQLVWAHNSGIDFFVFDWYFNPTSVEPASVEDLNSAINITHALPDRHGMQYAILYVDSDPFVVGPADWTAAVGQWTGYFNDPAYALVNGKPLFIVIDMGSMRQAFGSSAAVVGAFDQLRAAAKAQGFPGVYIVGGLYVPDGTSGQSSSFPDLSISQADGYDAVSMYGYAFVPPPIDGMLSFSTLSDTGKWIWDQVGVKSPVPLIPTAMDGWDPRPWDEREGLTNDMMWYSRTPQDVATFVNDAITWAESHPKFRVEPSPTAPMVLIEAWNELGEGSYMVPTVGDGTSYTDALAQMLVTPPVRARMVLTLNDNGPSAPNRTATGALTDATGTTVAGASVAVTATLVDGPGAYQQYPLASQVPAGATQAVVGFRINTEDAGPGTSDISLYQISYIQGGDGVERVVNGDFSSGTQFWSYGGEAQFVSSDRGPGQMVNAIATVSQNAALTSIPFSVTAGTPFQATFSARISPSSAGSGEFMVIFLSGGNEFNRQRVPFVAASLPVGTATTDSTGHYQLDLSWLGTTQLILESNYAGDATHWPGYARVAP